MQLGVPTLPIPDIQEVQVVGPSLHDLQGNVGLHPLSDPPPDSIS